jgi:3-methyladenine DNA glycosylase AlkD
VFSSDPNNVGAVVTEIVTRLRQLPDLNTQSVRCLRRRFTKHLAKAEPEVVVQIARRLLARTGFHYRFVAYELISHHRKALHSLQKHELVELADTLDSWAAVDTFALYIAGPCWRERQVQDSVIEGWARSKDRWWRRAALVCTVALNSKARGGIGDTQRTLKICRMLVSDRDDMVVKAQSWALRELGARDTQAVQKFLAQHESTLASRVLREVRNKLTTGLKNPRRRPQKSTKGT